MFNYHVDRKYELKMAMKIEEYLLRSDIKNHGKTDNYKYILGAVSHINQMAKYGEELKKLKKIQV
jgi:hypothetical protein